MRVGDLVRAKNTSTGDKPWWVKLWRERTPFLVAKLMVDDYADERAEIIIGGGERKCCRRCRLEVVSASR